MIDPNLWSRADMDVKKRRRPATPSFLLGRIEGLATALKASADVNVGQAADAIIADVELLAEALEQKQELPPLAG